jgi:hypothetical protein
MEARTPKNITPEDIADEQHKILEDWLAQFEVVDNDLGSLIFEIKSAEVPSLPRGIEHDLETIEICLNSVRCWLEDQLYGFTA